MKVHEMLVDVKARAEKEVAMIKRKIASEVKKAGCNTGEIRWSEDDGVYTVEIENDGKLGADLSDIIKKSPNGRLKRVAEYDGDYMWKIDRYIRPSSLISFTF